MPAFQIEPLARFGGPSTAIKRPREFAYFSYDDSRTLRPLSDQSLSYYYPPTFDTPGEKDGRPRIDLSNGFETFQKHDDGIDEHLDALLTTLAAHEEKTGQIVKADILTWRGMMTKVLISGPLYRFDAVLICVQDHDRTIRLFQRIRDECDLLSGVQCDPLYRSNLRLTTECVGYHVSR
jgi:hypothetical protein